MDLELQFLSLLFLCCLRFAQPFDKLGCISTIKINLFILYCLQFALTLQRKLSSLLIFNQIITKTNKNETQSFNSCGCGDTLRTEQLRTAAVRRLLAPGRHQELVAGDRQGR